MGQTLMHLFPNKHFQVREVIIITIVWGDLNDLQSKQTTKSYLICADSGNENRSLKNNLKKNNLKGLVTGNKEHVNAHIGMCAQGCEAVQFEAPPPTYALYFVCTITRFSICVQLSCEIDTNLISDWVAHARTVSILNLGWWTLL